MNQLALKFWGVVLLCIVCATPLVAQNNTSISYTNKGLTINNLVITPKTTIKEVKKALKGKSRKEKFLGKAVAYVFDEQGLIIYTQNKLVESINMSLVPDATEGAPKNKYSGTIIIGNTNVTVNTTHKDLESHKDLIMDCNGNAFCSLKFLPTNASCFLSFNKGTVFMVNFSFKPIML